MAVAERSSQLAAFLGYLDALTDRPPLAELRARLADSAIEFEDVAHAARFGETRYQRNLLRAGEHYHALVLCWRSGQRSPVHDHASSLCAVKVLKGVATETVYDLSPCGQYHAVASHDLRAGEMCVSADSDVHQMSNLQPAGEDLVTLHIYIPPLLRMATYDVEGRRHADWEDPIYSGFVGGAGI